MALRLSDLNDFITPSQACIKPGAELPKPTGKVCVGVLRGVLTARL